MCFVSCGWQLGSALLTGFEAATPPARRWSDEELSAELRSSSAAGMVLIKNDGLLPLAPSSLQAGRSHWP
jgi:hypothetical protein